MNAQVSPSNDAGCMRWDVVCCRLTVVLQSEVPIPPPKTRCHKVRIQMSAPTQAILCQFLCFVTMLCAGTRFQIV